ncbi:LPP20 family lipoprotein [Thermophagus sp. OGC60D27]|uniref:LPP20 family lipoprotein n=1 Tax=Thermophagus sp. OGC60D27 TaxID=3458415 RepID=UPI0040378791
MKFNRVFLTALTIALLTAIGGCRSSKDTAAGISEPPSWILNRPVLSGYYFGIGSVQKQGSSQLYRQRAADKAMADIAGQISTSIQSNVSIYQVEDKFGVREVFENQIKSESEDFLEGQELMDEYEDEQYYYVIYRLSKETYRQKREERRTKAINAALQNYKTGIEKLEINDYQLSVLFFVKALESISPFFDEKAVVADGSQTIDLFANPLEKLKNILALFTIKSSHQTMALSDQLDGLQFTVTADQGRPVKGVPIMFLLEGGYLISNRGETDINGQCGAPRLNYSNHRAKLTLTAKVDFMRWINQSTENIELRKLIKKWPVSECEVELVR